MYSWSISFDIISYTSCLIGLHYREGRYKKSEEDDEVREFIQFDFGFLLLTITLKIFFN